MNVQQIIIKGIKEQLYSHNYLVLPGFGGFVLKSRSAHFSASGGSLLPPSKTVSFNAQLKQNDGVMTVWLQQKLNCTPAEALNHLNEFSNFCSGVLFAKRRLSIDGVGFFYIDFENNICFEPQNDANFFSESFGLQAISLKPIIAEEVSEIQEERPSPQPKLKETVFTDRKIEREETPTVRRTSKRNFRKLINSVIVAALSISLLILIVNSSRTSGVIYSSAFDTKGGSTYSPLIYPELKLANSTVESDAYVTDANGIAPLELNEKKNVAVLALENKLNVTSRTAHFTVSKKGYEIVLGCFTVLSNAQRMNKKLSAQNIHNTISPKNAKGMYVISDGSFTNKEAAVQRLQDLKASFPNAWIKKVE